MDAQELFYIVATIALILLSIVLIASILLLFWIRKLLHKASFKVENAADNISSYVSDAGKAWGRLTLTTMAIRLITALIRRRT